VDNYKNKMDSLAIIYQDQIADGVEHDSPTKTNVEDESSAADGPISSHRNSEEASSSSASKPESILVSERKTSIDKIYGSDCEPSTSLLQPSQASRSPLELVTQKLSSELQSADGSSDSERGVSEKVDPRKSFKMLSPKICCRRRRSIE
jgi:hypothetical protein